jgi:hypothetical protein
MRWPFLLALSLFSVGCNKTATPTVAIVDPAKLSTGTQIEETVQPPTVEFRNTTREVGVHFMHHHGGYGKKLLPETMGSGVLVFDFNGDGHQDLLFVNSGRWAHYNYDNTVVPPTRIALYVNDGTGHFKDVTEEAGLAGISCYGMGAAAGDIDNDGFPEVVLTSLGRAILLHNEGGKRFKDISMEAGVECPGWSTAAAFLDYDRDGKLDLFVGHYVKWTVETDLFCSLDGKNKSYCQPDKYEGEHCQLFHNLGSNRFEDVSAKAGIQILDVTKTRPASKCLGVAVHDFDDDGWPDIAVANDTTMNFLFRNNGDGTFANVAGAKGVELQNERGSARGAMGIHWGYYRDGDTLGLGIANFANEPTGLLRYSRISGQFIDSASPEGINGPSLLPLKFGLLFFDYDLDGRLDLFTSNGHIEPDVEKLQARVKYAQPAQLFWNAGASKKGCYREVDEQHGGKDLFAPRVGRGCAYGDLDGDGDLDLSLNNNNQPATIVRNECPATAKSIRLKFRGATANRDGYGCRVKLWAGRVLQQAELSSGGSYLSQSEAVLTFGLGEKSKAEKVTIRWPNKELTVTELKDLEAGFTYVIDEKGTIVSKTPFRKNERSVGRIADPSR